MAYPHSDLILDWLMIPQAVDRQRLSELTDLDWEGLLERADQHRLLPMMAWNMARLPEASVPKHVTETLSDQYRSSTMRQLAIARDCILVHETLDRAGIPHLFLKGAYLGQACYPKPGLRPMRDIDVLVPAGQEVVAWETLSAAFGLPQQFQHIGADETFSPKHMSPVNTPSGECNVELHRSIYLDLEKNAYTSHLERLWHRHKDFEIAARKLPCPSSEDMLLHLVFHGINDHRLNLGPLFIVDLCFLLDAVSFDWNMICSEAEVLGISRPLELALTLVGRTPGEACSSEEHVPESVVQASRLLLLQDANKRYDIRHTSNVINRNSWNWGGYIWRKVIPTRTSLKRWHALEGRGVNTQTGYAGLYMSYLLGALSKLYRSTRDREVTAMIALENDVMDWVAPQNTGKP
ncbi:nucleotidyltransferase domain-containing protein [Aliiruegeria sabulilitoris]|uniref:nucleotidyltransferase domain-containing protein n=1 Tax=Aliiruegeria sabulilitoris TaxID=1510458 RepID=UPI000833E702|nr:nucleotidyltransferase family protein [Aliiruegeria sabulilitoris]NDR55711.1 nucleotidyltransferase family protein [Pseudoruegeria sp. M32A2M]